MVGKSGFRHRTLWIVWGLWLAATVLLIILASSVLSPGVPTIVVGAVMLALTAITWIAQNYIRASASESADDAVAPGSPLMVHEQLIRQELTRLSRQLFEQLGRDELTGLHNRRALQEFIRTVITAPGSELRPLSIVMMDLDHFKRINDHHGHFSADRLLVHLAQLWVKRIRASDLLARVGGDEFCLVLPDTTLAQALMVAHKLLDACNDADHLWRQQEVTPRTEPAATMPTQQFPDSDIQALSVSIGVANADHPSPNDISSLLELADSLLYESKRAGGGIVTVGRHESQTPAV